MRRVRCLNTGDTSNFELVISSFSLDVGYNGYSTWPSHDLMERKGRRCLLRVDAELSCFDHLGSLARVTPSSEVRKGPGQFILVWTTLCTEVNGKTLNAPSECCHWCLCYVKLTLTASLNSTSRVTNVFFNGLHRHLHSCAHIYMHAHTETHASTTHNWKVLYNCLLHILDTALPDSRNQCKWNKPKIITTRHGLGSLPWYSHVIKKYIL